MKLICSDFHFQHDKEFIWKERGFSSVDEMNKEIIRRYNTIIREEDDVYILGDCIMGKLDSGLELLKQLKGKKYLAYGNHDTDNRLKAYKESGMFEDIQMGYRLSHGKYSLILTHYPTLVANREDPKKVWSIHGHTHDKEKFNKSVSKTYNVCMDAHECFPIDLEEIIKDIKEERIKYEDLKKTLST